MGSSVPLRPRGQTVLRGAVLSLAVVLALLAGIEVFVRARLGAPMINDTLRADPVLGFRTEPKRLTCSDELGRFEFAVNSRGFRGRELPEGAKPAGARRVLLLGDSFLQAWMVRGEEWVGTVVADELARLGRPAEVYALSTIDYGTAQELLLLREHGARVQPDEVVLFLYTTNDLINNTLEMAGYSTISANDYFRPYFVPDGDGGFVVRSALPARAWLRKSCAFQHLERRWLSGRTLTSLRAELVGERLLEPHERVQAGLLPESQLEIYRPVEPGGVWDTAWKRTEALVLATRAEAERLGAGFTVVVIPELQQVTRTLTAIAREDMMRAAGWKEPEEALDLEAPSRRIEEFLERTGTAHVQMLGPLRRRVVETGKAVYLNDGHLNGAGHRLMGELLAQRLAPGGADVGYELAGGPVDPCAFLTELPLTLDLARSEHWELFGWGWSKWISPHSGARFPGWGLPQKGLFLARAAEVTLEGRLLDRSARPVTLTVRRNQNGPPLASLRLAAPGPFSLSFALPSEGEEWVPLWLGLAGEAGSPLETSSPNLVLQKLSFADRQSETVPPVPGS